MKTSTEDDSLTPDTRWSGYKTLSDFGQVVTPFYFRPEVPVVIRNQFTIVRKLMLHSYYEYEFLDIALVRSLQIFEMALKIRYVEIKEGEFNRQSFSKIRKKLKGLIEWAGRNGLLEQSESVTQNLRNIRNFMIHGDPTSLMGITSLQGISFIVDFVNDLYEDVELRKTRHSIETELQQLFSDVVDQGAILTIDNSRLIIFHAEMLVCLIDESETSCNVGFYPIFEAKEIKGSIRTPDPICLEFRKHEVNQRTLVLIDKTGNTTKLETISDEINRKRFDDFKLEYKKHKLLDFALKTSLHEYRHKLRRSYIRSMFTVLE